MTASARQARAQSLRRAAVTGLVVAWILPTWACGSDSEAPSAGVSPATSSTRAASPAASGSPSKAGSPLAGKVPAGVPHYPGADLIDLSGNADSGTSVTFETGDDPRHVTDKLEKALDADGWMVTRDERASTFTLFGDRGGQAISLVIESKNDRTSISVLLVALE